MTTVRRYRNDTGYPLEVPGLAEPVPPGGEVDEADIALQHDPKSGGSIPGLTLITKPAATPAKEKTDSGGKKPATSSSTATVAGDPGKEAAE
jgi:hypothetical protein